MRYARHLENAGAQAIELNVYDVVADPRQSAADVERRYLDLVAEVRAEVTVPLAVKLGPWFTSLGHFAVALQSSGADGLVLFNRLYQPDIDLDTLDVTPRLQLSTSCRVTVAAPLDRHSPWRHVLLARCHDRRARRRRRDEAIARRRRRGDDGQRTAAARAGADRRGPRLDDRLDDRTRVFERRPTARQRQPTQCPRSRGVRAGQLLPGPAQLAALSDSSDGIRGRTGNDA